MTTVTEEYLKRLSTLTDATSPGPWEPRRMPGASPDGEAQYMVATYGGEQIADCHDNTRWSHEQTTVNAAFIAASRIAVRTLLDEIAQSREERGLADEEIRQLRVALGEAIAIFDATWCPEHGHAPKPEQLARVDALRKLARP